MGALFEETYLCKLEEKLNKRTEETTRNIEVIKAGIPRYFPPTERMLLEKYGLSYRPDLVIVGVLPNDVVDTYFGIDAVRAGSDWLPLDSRSEGTRGDVGAMIYRRSHLEPPDPARTYLDRKLRPHWNELYKPNGYHRKGLAEHGAGIRSDGRSCELHWGQAGSGSYSAKGSLDR